MAFCRPFFGKKNLGNPKWKWFSTKATPLNPLIKPNINIDATQLYINGEFRDACNDERIPVYDPRNDDIITYIASAQSNDVEYAIKCARNAFDNGEWTRMSSFKRGDILFNLVELMIKHKEELTNIEIWDTGKPYGEAEMDIEFSIQYVKYYAGLATSINSGESSMMENNKMCSTYYEPLGVIGSICPWNVK